MDNNTLNPIKRPFTLWLLSFLGLAYGVSGIFVWNEYSRNTFIILLGMVFLGEAILTISNKIYRAVCMAPIIASGKGN